MGSFTYLTLHRSVDMGRKSTYARLLSENTKYSVSLPSLYNLVITSAPQFHRLPSQPNSSAPQAYPCPPGQNPQCVMPTP